MKSGNKFLLPLILLTAVALYVVGLNHAFFVSPPEWHMGWHDEVNRINIRMFFNRSLDPQWFFHPSLFYYVTAVFYIPYLYIYHLIHGVPIDGIMAARPELTFHLMVVSRTVTAAFALLLIWASYRLGKACGGRRAGLIAAVFMAFNGGVNAFAHVAHPMVPALFFMAGAMYFLVSFQKTGTKKYFYFACAASGLAISTYYVTAIVLPSLFISLIPDARTRGPGGNTGKRRERGGLVKAAAAGFLLVVLCFLAATPYALLDFETFKFHFVYQYLNKGNSELNAGAGMSYHLIPGFYFLVLGVPMGIACLFGTFQQLVKWIKTRDAVLTSFFVALIPFLLFIGAWKRLEPRWLIVASPFMIVLCSVAFTEADGLFRKKAHRFVLYSLLVLVTAFSLARCFAGSLSIVNDPRNDVTAYLAGREGLEHVYSFGILYALFHRAPEGVEISYINIGENGFEPFAEKLAAQEPGKEIVTLGLGEGIRITDRDGKVVFDTDSSEKFPDEFKLGSGCRITADRAIAKGGENEIVIPDFEGTRTVKHFYRAPYLGAYPTFGHPHVFVIEAE